MRRPSLRMSAGILALGALGLAAPIAIGAVNANTITAGAPLAQTPPGTAPAGQPPASQPGGQPPAAYPGQTPGQPHEPTAEQKAAHDAFNACMKEHGVEVPTPPTGGQGQPRPRGQQQGPKQPTRDPAEAGRGATNDQGATNSTGAAPTDPGEGFQPNPGQGPGGQRPPLDAAHQAAFDACKDLLPKPTPPTAEELAKIRAFEACMKEHGVEIPPFDPTAAPKNPGQKPDDATKPKIDPETMKAAHEACKDLLPFPNGGPGGQGGPGGHGGPGGQNCPPGKGGPGNGGPGNATPGTPPGSTPPTTTTPSPS